MRIGYGGWRRSFGGSGRKVGGLGESIEGIRVRLRVSLWLNDFHMVHK